MNEDVIKTMKETGCFSVCIGAERGSQRIIDAMDRRVKVEQVRKMIQLAKKHRIETGTFIMLGYPGGTEKDIEETIKHLKLSGQDQFDITIAYQINGTEFFEEVEAKQVGNFIWEDQTDRERKFMRADLKKYYKYSLRRVNNEFNFQIFKSKNQLFTIQAMKYKGKSVLAKADMKFEKVR